jgi:hypothetical protein
MLQSLRRAAAAVGAVTVLLTMGAATAGAAVFRVSVGAAQGRPVASDFLGLALEYRSIPAFTSADPSAVNPVLVQLVRNLVPQGRPVFRIGGQSTDRTWWPVPGTRPPLGVTYSLTSTWIASVRALAQATNARLILGLGLEADRPKLAAVEAQELMNGLGRNYIDAFEIGNEPELYPVVPWYRKLHGTLLPWYSHLGAPVFARPRGYGPGTFDGEFSRALGSLPGVPVAGPSVGLVPWLDGFRRFLAPQSRVKMVTWHAYGLNQCVTDRSSPSYPTVPNLLAPRASRELMNGISPVVALAHQAGASFRVDEMNSVTCNGRLGVSNTFASALWVMDALFAIAADGVDGVNVHTFEDAANGLFDFDRTGGQWEATVHPLYYGLMMFAQAAPAGSHLAQISSDAQAQVRAWATRGPDHRLRVLLINDSVRRPARAQVRAPAAAGPASVELLRAGSAYATSGVALGGQSFGLHTTSGVLDSPQTSSLARRSGNYALTLPPASAALVTVATGPYPIARAAG